MSVLCVYHPLLCLLIIIIVYICVCVYFFHQVLSGDTVIIRGQPRGGPPPERTLCLSNVTAPRPARRPNPNIDQGAETRDEVCLEICNKDPVNKHSTNKTNQ